MKKNDEDHREYLKRCKYSSPESKFEWLESALLFGKSKKKIINKK